MLRDWDELPKFMRTEEARLYWEVLNKRRVHLYLKRAFDLVVAWLLFVLLSLSMIIIAILIKVDSRGPFFYRQERIIAYGRKFRIHKYRTMVSNADKIGTAVTVGNDSRITSVGAKLRRLRLDELPQVLGVIAGERDIIGTTKKNLDFMRFSAA